jgi:hypothetical protein
LGRTKRENYGDWFDAECEQVIATKIVANKRVHERNHTRNAVEENSAAKRVEKTLHKSKKVKYTKDKLEKKIRTS